MKLKYGWYYVIQFWLIRDDMSWLYDHRSILKEFSDLILGCTSIIIFYVNLICFTRYFIYYHDHFVWIFWWRRKIPIRLLWCDLCRNQIWNSYICQERKVSWEISTTVSKWVVHWVPFEICIPHVLRHMLELWYFGEFCFFNRIGRMLILG